VLADFHPRRTRGDRLKRPAHFRRSLRLQIEHVEMTGSSGQKNQDHAAIAMKRTRRLATIARATSANRSRSIPNNRPATARGDRCRACVGESFVNSLSAAFNRVRRLAYHEERASGRSVFNQIHRQHRPKQSTPGSHELCKHRSDARLGYCDCRSVVRDQAPVGAGLWRAGRRFECGS
jgi:hypothetical protein